MQAFPTVLLLLLALGVGLAAHGLCIRLGCARALARPIDCGRTWRGRRIFGENKTFRGIVAVGAGSGIGTGLVALLARAALPASPLAGLGLTTALLLGLGSGAAAMLSELPNSFLKRRLDIPPGRAPTRGAAGALFLVLDQVDMLVGWWLVLAVLVRPTVGLVLGSVVAWLVLHQAISALGYRLGMRTSAR